MDLMLDTREKAAVLQLARIGTIGYSGVSQLQPRAEVVDLVKLADRYAIHNPRLAGRALVRAFELDKSALSVAHEYGLDQLFVAFVRQQVR